MSSIVPIQNSVFQVSNPINEGKHIANESGSRQYEDSLGDLPEESTRRDSLNHKSQNESNPENQDDQKGKENVSDNTAEENQQEVVRDGSGEKHNLEKGSGNTIEENDQMRQVKPSREEKESDRNLNSEFVETETQGGQINDDELRGSVETLDEMKSDKSINDNKLGTEKSIGEVSRQDEMDGETEVEKVKKNLHSNTKQSNGENNMESHENSQVSKEVSITGNRSETLTEASTERGNWSTQAVESQHEKESLKSSISIDSNKYDWKLCNTTAGSEYIPCLDNVQAIRKLPSIRHHEHRERHCPDEATTCLVPLPEGYRTPIKWPKSRDMVCNT